MSRESLTDDLFHQAWASRRANFPHRIEFVYPQKTLPVSVTENECALNCAHCGGSYLREMSSLDKALCTGNESRTSFLVSGGCDRDGNVPLMYHREKIRELARIAPLNIHTGFVDDDEAREIAGVAKVVSFNFIADDETVEEVCGLKNGAARYIESYRSLRKYACVVPHICIGLKGGSIKGEYKALEVLRREGAEALSFIVFRPTAGTAYGNLPEPPLAEVAAVLVRARLIFPRLTISLGCLRPGGSYRSSLDCLALRAGVNKIVKPAPAARSMASALGLNIIQSEECCSL